MDEIKLAELRTQLKITLANDVCSAQCLDNPADRRRVLDEIMRTVRTFADVPQEEAIID